MHRLSNLALPADGPLRRAPPRPPALQQESYLAEFDDLTLFYDVFRDPSGRRAVAVGPPPLNLGTLLRQMTVSARRGGPRLSFSLIERLRGGQVWIQCGAGTDRLVLGNLPFACPELPIQPGHCDLFAGRRAIVTKNKNNDLAWIADWARFYRKAHGAEGFLLHDNGSTLYSPDELRATVVEASGGARCEVVRWPYKFGPDGGPARIWDSDYCDHGMLEHARWRYLAAARSVLNVDIDELVMSPRRESVFAATERSRDGITAIARCWVPGPPPPSRVPRFADFDHRDRRLRPVGKWCIVPERCPFGMQWLVHVVEGFDGAPAPEDEFLIRHYWAITTGWKAARREALPIDREWHARDPVAIEQLAAYLGRD